jgi:EAL domain-containing protein (putative c-di-GMP-specific phosphodiesterase class I)
VVTASLKWFSEHAEALERLRLCSINLSGHSLGNEEFLEFLGDLIHAGNTPPEKICFEVTETAAITNLSKAIHFMAKLKKLGCCFALDDFGSGLSSFKYLKTLPVDFVKIDGMFVKDIVNDPIQFAMVKSINEMAHLMGKQTIAESVENAAILSKAREVGVDYVQGYRIGSPVLLETMQ